LKLLRTSSSKVGAVSVCHSQTEVLLELQNRQSMSVPEQRAVQPVRCRRRQPDRLNAAVTVCEALALLAINAKGLWRCPPLFQRWHDVAAAIQS